MKTESYLTLQKPSHDEIVIQKSRFIGYASPCGSEEEALAYLRTIREMHRDARHHCYAYVIGSNSGITRYSDDGEPGGTAGLPMMNVLKSAGIVNCCVVVVRYFGGILLGTGGLVRAYTQGCKIALQAASVIRMVRSSVRRCHVSYPVWNQLQYVLQKTDAVIQSINYTDHVDFSLCTKAADMDRITKALNDVTDGKIRFEEASEEYIQWENERI